MTILCKFKSEYDEKSINLLKLNKESIATFSFFSSLHEDRNCGKTEDDNISG